MPFFKHHPPPGSSPGSLTPPPDSAPTRVRVMVYGPAGVEERAISDPAELAPLRRAEHVAWIDVQGLADVALLQRIGEIFGLHPLALEDAVNVPVRPKAELFDSCHEIVTRMAQLDAQGRVQEIVDGAARMQAVAALYRAHPKGTLVVSPDNQSREQLNGVIRRELQAAGRVATAT